MRVVMTFHGGRLDGSHIFEDNDDIMIRLNQTQDPHLAVAMVVDDSTDNGRVGRASKGFTPALFDLLKRGGIPDDLKSSAQSYRIIKRTEDPIENTIEIVAEYLPPKSE